MSLTTVRTALTANGTANPLTGTQFEFAPYAAAVEFAIQADATGVLATVQTGTDVLQEEGPVQLGTINVQPKYPDDFFLNDVVMQGERIKVALRDTSGVARTVMTVVKLTALYMAEITATGFATQLVAGLALKGAQSFSLSDGVVPVVSVGDANREPFNRHNGFMFATVQAAVIGNFSVLSLELATAVASNVAVVVRKIGLNAPATQVFRIYMSDTNPATAQPGGLSLDGRKGRFSQATVRAGAIAALPALQDLIFAGEVVGQNVVQLDQLIVVTPGRGVLVTTTNQNQAVNLSMSWDEHPLG